MKNLSFYLLILFNFYHYSFSQTKIYEVTAIPIPSEYETRYWNWVNLDLLGIEGVTNNEQYVSRFPADKWGAFSSGNWYPIDGFKHILRGKLVDIGLWRGDYAHYDELDFNWIVKPAKNFTYLTNFNLFRKPDHIKSDNYGPYERLYYEMISTSDVLPHEWYIDSEEKQTTYNLEAEITTHSQFSEQNPNFMFDINQIILNVPGKIDGKVKNILGNEICFYGPWVYETWHTNRPEIHPAEIVWWNEFLSQDSIVKSILVLKDKTDYFDERSDFYIWDKTNETSIGWQAWNDSLVDATINVAFRLSDKNRCINLDIKCMKELESKDMLFRNVKKVEEPTKEVILISNNKPIVKVNILDKNLTKSIYCSFDNVYSLSDGTIIGFIKLQVSVGIDDLNEINDGYLGMNLIMKNIDNSIHIPISSRIPVLIKHLYENTELNTYEDRELNKYAIADSLFRLLCKEAGKLELYEEYYSIVKRDPRKLNSYEINDTNKIKLRIVDVEINNFLDQMNYKDYMDFNDNLSLLRKKCLQCSKLISFLK